MDCEPPGPVEYTRRLFLALTLEPLAACGQDEVAELMRDDRRLLTVLSALGPGVQILILDLYTIAGFRHLGLALELFLWTIVLGGTLYAAAVVMRLRRAARRESRRGGAE